MTVRKGKRAVWPSVLLEASQEVWYAVYGSIAEEGTSPSRAASSFLERLSHVAVLNTLSKAPS